MTPSLSAHKLYILRLNMVRLEHLDMETSRQIGA